MSKPAAEERSQTDTERAEASNAPMAEDQTPTNDQAIVFDDIVVWWANVNLYTVALGKIIDPKKILFVSKISEDRICFYLNSKETADELTESHTKMKLGKCVIEARPLIPKAMRIQLQDIFPHISNEMVIETLANYNVQPCSKIEFIRTKLKKAPAAAHILSFDRQFYVRPEDVPKLPPILEFEIDEISYTAKLVCFAYREDSHLVSSSNLVIIPSTIIT